jgi:hypothetical protein
MGQEGPLRGSLTTSLAGDEQVRNGPQDGRDVPLHPGECRRYVAARIEDEELRPVPVDRRRAVTDAEMEASSHVVETGRDAEEAHMLTEPDAAVGAVEPQPLRDVEGGVVGDGRDPYRVARSVLLDRALQGRELGDGERAPPGVVTARVEEGQDRGSPGEGVVERRRPAVLVPCPGGAAPVQLLQPRQVVEVVVLGQQQDGSFALDRQWAVAATPWLLSLARAVVKRSLSAGVNRFAFLRMRTITGFVASTCAVAAWETWGTASPSSVLGRPKAPATVKSTPVPSMGICRSSVTARTSVREAAKANCPPT